MLYCPIGIDLTFPPLGKKWLFLPQDRVCTVWGGSFSRGAVNLNFPKPRQSRFAETTQSQSVKSICGSDSNLGGFAIAVLCHKKCSQNTKIQEHKNTIQRSHSTRSLLLRASAGISGGKNWPPRWSAKYFSSTPAENRSKLKYKIQKCTKKQIV